MTKLDIENVVFTEMVEILSDPMCEGEFISVPNLVSLAANGSKGLVGLTEKDIRNACRRLKRKGLIEHEWERYNTDQPSGEYGEVWSGEPFIPHHGYAPSEKGRETELYKTVKKRVLDEWDSYWEKTLQETPVDSKPENEERSDKLMTNRECIIAALSGKIDDGGASYEATVHYNIACPYTAGEHFCDTEGINRNICVACKMEWLEQEVSE